MDKAEEIIKSGTELTKIPQGPKREKLAREILLLYKKIMQEYNAGSDLYDEAIGEIHACAMSAFRELEMYEEAFEEGEEALVEEEMLDEQLKIRILNELLGICIILYKKSDSRDHLNKGRTYGKQLLKMDPGNKLKPLIVELFEL